MQIHKEGYSSIIVVGLSLIILSLIIWYFFPASTLFHFIFELVSLIILGIVIYFFRVPNRKLIPDDNAIYSVADGKVVAIEEVFDTEYFNDHRLQVSVFMSPLNVHVNYYPMDGKVMHAEHKPGKHIPAFKAKSSMENEQSCIVVRHHKNKEDVLMRQIAGSLARRIVFFSKKDENVKQGKQLGIIKFGSRLDLLLPTNAKVQVEIGQKVKAGMDVIATFK